MLSIRRSEDRGYADHGWLQSHHTFSFAGYYDPRFNGFRNLRVINQDRVAAGKGFPTHGHREMEIISYVLEGALEHHDSLGNGSVIRPGDVQRMSAGTGVHHSEYNHLPDADTRFFQIWLLPSQAGVAPGYAQQTFAEADRRGRLRLVASPDGAEGSVSMNADARIYAGLLEAGERATVALAPGRHAWVQLARGVVVIEGETLRAGDGAAVVDLLELKLEAREPAEVLLLDLA